MLLYALALHMTTQDISIPDLMRQVDQKRLKATVEHLAAMNTRNTSTPELQQAAEWVASELRKINGLEVELMPYVLPASRRVPQEKTVVQVVAKLKGIDPRVLLVGGHLDSLNTAADVMTGRAPGANDDASGVALSMELARVMAQRKWKRTLVYVAFTGEEQGLNGSRALAQRATKEGWKIDGVLNNDTVGSSSNKAGQKDARRVRVFSEEAAPTDEKQHQSRELARFIEWNARQGSKGFGVKLVFRRDRFGRGGDHTPFVQEGFTGVRFIEVFEEYTRQHTVEDLPQYMDFGYLANVTRLNLLTMGTLAEAGDPPTNVRVATDQSIHTTLTWTAAKGSNYVVYWRETTSPTWQGSKNVGAVGRAVIESVNKDDHIFAVGAEGGIPVPAR